MSIQSTESSEADDELAVLPTPFLNQLLAEIKLHREQRRTVKNDSSKPARGSTPSKPEIQRHASVLSAHGKPPELARQKPRRKEAHTSSMRDGDIPKWLRAGGG